VYVCVCFGTCPSPLSDLQASFADILSLFGKYIVEIFRIHGSHTILFADSSIWVGVIASLGTCQLP